jgi:hypothetical protein
MERPLKTARFGGILQIGAGLRVRKLATKRHFGFLSPRADFGVSSPATKLATEEWPICTTMGSMGSEADWAKLDPDFAAGKRALVAEDWNGAIAALKLAVLRDPRNADIHNYIDYAYRRLRQFGPAMQYYQQALVLNRRHRRARTGTSVNSIWCSGIPPKPSSSLRRWKRFA